MSAVMPQPAKALLQIDTLAFEKPTNKKNYPGIADVVAHPISPNVGERLLQFGYDQVAKRRRLGC